MKIPRVFLYAGLGAALMYLFDPQQGNRRRALLRDQAYSAMNDAEKMLDARSDDLSNRAKGVIAKTKRMLKTETITNQQLEARVRSEMGRWISSTGTIDVMANNGEVTLSGTGVADEIEGLVSHIKAVPGVSRVINRVNAGKGGTESGAPKKRRTTTSKTNTNP
jgi:hypothetical protein